MFCIYLAPKPDNPDSNIASVIPANVVNKNGGFLIRLRNTRGNDVTSGLLGSIAAILSEEPLWSCESRVLRISCAAEKTRFDSCYIISVLKLVHADVLDQLWELVFDNVFFVSM